MLNCTTIAEIDGGKRNHIILGNMFGNDCEPIFVKFKVAETKEGLQMIYRTDSNPDPLEEVVSEPRAVKYQTDQVADQFLPVIYDNGKVGLFDCRAAKDVLSDFDKLEILSSHTSVDDSIRDSDCEWPPCQVRMILCKVQKNDKFGLLAVISVDSRSYGFDKKDFETSTQLKTFKEIEFDSIVIDLDNNKIILKKNGKIFSEPM